MPFTRPESAQRISHTPEGDPDGKTYYIPDVPASGTYCPEIEFETDNRSKDLQNSADTPLIKVPSA